MIALFVFGIIVGILIGMYVGKKIYENRVPNYLQELVGTLNKKMNEEAIKKIKERLEDKK